MMSDLILARAKPIDDNVEITIYKHYGASLILHCGKDVENTRIYDQLLSIKTEKTLTDIGNKMTVLTQCNIGGIKHKKGELHKRLNPFRYEDMSVVIYFGKDIEKTLVINKIIHVYTTKNVGKRRWYSSLLKEEELKEITIVYEGEEKLIS